MLPSQGSRHNFFYSSFALIYLLYSFLDFLWISLIAHGTWEVEEGSRLEELKMDGFCDFGNYHENIRSNHSIAFWKKPGIVTSVVQQFLSCGRTTLSEAFDRWCVRWSVGP